MTAVAAAWPVEGAAAVAGDAIAGVAGNPDLLARGARDQVGGLYRRMHDRGELVVTEGRVVDAAAVLGVAVLRWGMPEVVLCDAYRKGELLDALDEAGTSGGSRGA